MNSFLEIDPNRILFKNDLFFVIADGYPVSPGHLLIISNEVRSDYFNLTTEERNGLDDMIFKCKQQIEVQFRPTGYNIGMNCGASAGQTIFHFHCHVIPRYDNDTPNPRGGVRNCIPGKGNY